MNTETRIKLLFAALLCFETATVFGQPIITRQPVDQWMDLDAAVTHQITASGTRLSYQWRFDGAPLADATNRTLVLTNFQPTLAGSYSVVVTNTSGAVTSRVAKVEANIIRPHVFQSINAQPDGSISLRLEGNPTGWVRRYFDLYLLETSSDLLKWTPLTTLLRTNTSTDALTFLDADAGRFAHRFYRTPTNHFPTPFPKPAGPYDVGSFSRLITDHSRTNRYNVATNSSFMITVWYPARLRAGDRPAALYELPIARDAATWRNYGFSSLETVMPFFVGHSRLNAELATNGSPYPVLIMSPGLTDIRGDHAGKLELFASHGYVAISIDHAHCYATVFPDGRLLRSGANISQPLAPYFTNSVKDMQFVLEELTRMNQDDPILKGSLDLERVATMGHSFGGGVAGELARLDSRVKASVHLDAYYQSANTLLQLGLQKPLLYAYSTEAGGLQSLFNKTTRDAFSLQLRSTRHVDLGDNGAWVDRADHAARRAAVAMNACTLSFLNKYLKGLDDRLLDDPAAQFPEVANFKKK